MNNKGLYAGLLTLTLFATAACGAGNNNNSTDLEITEAPSESAKKEHKASPEATPAQIESLSESMLRQQEERAHEWDEPDDALNAIFSALYKDTDFAFRSIDPDWLVSFAEGAHIPGEVDLTTGLEEGKYISKQEAITRIARGCIELSDKSAREMLADFVNGLGVNNPEIIDRSYQATFSKAQTILRLSGIKDPEGALAEGLMKLGIHVAAKVNELYPDRINKPIPQPRRQTQPNSPPQADSRGDYIIA